MANVYKAFYKGKQPIEIHTAKTSYEAQCMAATIWNLKPSKRCDVTVVLAEKDGKPVVHVATE
jgi:hypothetical protein